MEVLYHVTSWGSPLGLALFFFFSGAGAGIFFWGFAHFVKCSKKDEEERS